MGAELQKILELPTTEVGYKGHEDRKTPELVFVLVEPIGGGAKQAAQILSELLESTAYGYKANPISLSGLIRTEALKRNYEEPALHELLVGVADLSDEAVRINRLQQWGNRLRKEKGADYLAKKVIQKIFEHRLKGGGFVDPSAAEMVPKPLRVAHIVKSVKNKAELALLKSVYGSMMILIAVSGDYEQQAKNFRQFGDAKDDNDKILIEYDLLAAIDQDEGVSYGQQVRDVFYKANLFINSNLSTVKDDVRHFLTLLFSSRIGSPTVDERMMFEAYSASVRSTCLSRQVGAAISDSQGDLVSIGWNDVPAFGGGLSSDNVKAHSEALCKHKKCCRSDTEKNVLIESAYLRLAKSGLLKTKATRERLEKVLRSAITSGLIEFSRAIHAEMEAILSSARGNRPGLRGGTLYVTTYPCDNCVKHILASGISVVKYIEPYPKSRAKAFFSDFLSDDTDHKKTRTSLRCFNLLGLRPSLTSCCLGNTAREREKTALLLGKTKSLCLEPQRTLMGTPFTRGELPWRPPMKNRQYPLPLEVQAPSKIGAVEKQCNSSGGGMVSITAYKEILKDKEIHEVAKRYIDAYKIFK